MSTFAIPFGNDGVTTEKLEQKSSLKRLEEQVQASTENKNL